MPIFALANTDVMLSGMSLLGLLNHNIFGVLAGLLIGKPLGIIIFSLLVVKMRLSTPSDGISYRHLIGAGFLSRIGFTMSIFIILLAFNDPALVQSSKIVIILALLSAGTIGSFILSRDSGTLLLKKKKVA